ncbi:MAG: hypothetical protein G8237_00550 [Magnetococcales bacterium]|nr:hypothetical protein [Magnetococcales bacterium]NGZ04829.1 hypothetical protein [Magnetococcales bacterium]
MSESDAGQSTVAESLNNETPPPESAPLEPTVSHQEPDPGTEVFSAQPEDQTSSTAGDEPPSEKGAEMAGEKPKEKEGQKTGSSTASIHNGGSNPGRVATAGKRSTINQGKMRKKIEITNFFRGFEGADERVADSFSARDVESWETGLSSVSLTRSFVGWQPDALGDWEQVLMTTRLMILAGPDQECLRDSAFCLLQRLGYQSAFIAHFARITKTNMTLQDFTKCSKLANSTRKALIIDLESDPGFLTNLRLDDLTFQTALVTDLIHSNMHVVCYGSPAIVNRSYRRTHTQLNRSIQNVDWLSYLLTREGIDHNIHSHVEQWRQANWANKDDQFYAFVVDLINNKTFAQKVQSWVSADKAPKESRPKGESASQSDAMERLVQQLRSAETPEQVVMRAICFVAAKFTNLTLEDFNLQVARLLTDVTVQVATPEDENSTSRKKKKKEKGVRSTSKTVSCLEEWRKNPDSFFMMCKLDYKKESEVKYVCFASSWIFQELSDFFETERPNFSQQAFETIWASHVQDSGDSERVVGNITRLFREWAESVPDEEVLKRLSSLIEPARTDASSGKYHRIYRIVKLLEFTTQVDRLKSITNRLLHTLANNPLDQDVMLKLLQYSGSSKEFDPVKWYCHLVEVGHDDALKEKAIGDLARYVSRHPNDFIENINAICSRIPANSHRSSKPSMMETFASEWMFRQAIQEFFQDQPSSAQKRSLALSIFNHKQCGEDGARLSGLPSWLMAGSVIFNQISFSDFIAVSIEFLAALCNRREMAQLLEADFNNQLVTDINEIMAYLAKSDSAEVQITSEMVEILLTLYISNASVINRTVHIQIFLLLHNQIKQDMQQMFRCWIMLILSHWHVSLLETPASLTQPKRPQELQLFYRFVANLAKMVREDESRELRNWPLDMARVILNILNTYHAGISSGEDKKDIHFRIQSMRRLIDRLKEGNMAG